MRNVGEFNEKERFRALFNYSSLVAVIIVIVCSVVTVSSNIVIKQSLHQGVLFDLIELKSQGMIELDDLFDDIFD